MNLLIFFFFNENHDLDYFLYGGELEMTVTCVAYNSNIENMIIANLDGWVIETPSPTPVVETVENQTTTTTKTSF